MQYLLYYMQSRCSYRHSRVVFYLTFFPKSLKFCSQKTWKSGAVLYIVYYVAAVHEVPGPVAFALFLLTVAAVLRQPFLFSGAHTPLIVLSLLVLISVIIL